MKKPSAAAAREEIIIHNETNDDDDVVKPSRVVRRSILYSFHTCTHNAEKKFGISYGVRRVRDATTSRNFLLFFLFSFSVFLISRHTTRCTRITQKQNVSESILRRLKYCTRRWCTNRFLIKKKKTIRRYICLFGRQYV